MPLWSKAVFFLAVLADARPIVRDIKDASEFEKLLKHHRTVTGLPVVRTTT